LLPENGAFAGKNFPPLFDVDIIYPKVLSVKIFFEVFIIFILFFINYLQFFEKDGINKY